MTQLVAHGYKMCMKCVISATFHNYLENSWISVEFPAEDRERFTASKMVLEMRQ